jgi:phosphatidylserine decarboxylase
MRNNLLPIAKEGWKYLLFSFVSFSLFLLLDWNFFATIAFFTTLLFLFFFRNPERELPTFEADSFVSLSDGVVNSIEEIKDVEGYFYKVEIEGSYLDVALLRMPMQAQLTKFKKYSGTRVSKQSSLFNTLNENISLTFEDENKNNFRVDFRVKNSFCALEADILVAQKLNQAVRFGFMLQGVTTLYLPSNFRLNIQKGNRLKASESLIGYFS